MSVMPDPQVRNRGRTSHTDPEYLPPATAAALARTWERLLAERYPGSAWTVTYEPPDG